MTKTPFNLMQDGGIPAKEETYAFIDGSKPAPVLDPQPKDMENNVYMETTKRLLKKRRSIYPICGALFAAVCLVWLVGLTVVRELQLAEIRDTLDKLQEEMEGIKRSIMEDGLLDELNGFQDEVNAESDKRLSNKIDLYDGPLTDDEDFEDDLVEGSGEYSMGDDYDNSFKFGSKGLTKEREDIDREDFLGEVMEATLQDKSLSSSDSDSHPPIVKKIRILHEDEQMGEKNSRSKREVVSRTPDGVPVRDEPYGIKNSSHHQPRMLMDWYSAQDGPENKGKHNIKKYHLEDSTSKPSLVRSRLSRVQQSEGENWKDRRMVVRRRKPMVRSGRTSEYPTSYQSQRSDEYGMNRRFRRFREQKLQSRATESMEEIELNLHKPSAPVIVAHFNGDTSNLQVGRHEHYEGNGRLRHPLEVPYTKWAAAPWVPPMGMDAHFPLRDGAVTVSETGIYFIYAQVYFHDSHDTNSFKVYRNNGVADEAILQCTTMTHSKERINKANTCYTAGAFHLSQGDTIFLQNLGSMRYSIMQPGKSFFGLIKLGDAKMR